MRLVLIETARTKMYPLIRQKSTPEPRYWVPLYIGSIFKEYSLLLLLTTVSICLGLVYDFPMQPGPSNLAIRLQKPNGDGEEGWVIQ